MKELKATEIHIRGSLNIKPNELQTMLDAMIDRGENWIADRWYECMNDMQLSAIRRQMSVGLAKIYDNITEEDVVALMNTIEKDELFERLDSYEENGPRVNLAFRKLEHDGSLTYNVSAVLDLQPIYDEIVAPNLFAYEMSHEREMQ